MLSDLLPESPSASAMLDREAPRPEVQAPCSLIHPRNQSRRPVTVSVVLLTKPSRQQRLLRVHARDQRRHQQDGHHDTDTRTKRQPPSKGQHDQPKVARVANETINTRRDQRVIGLDRDQPAEAIPKDINRPKSQHTTRREQPYPDPASGFSINHPEVVTVRPGGQPAVEQTDQCERRDDPTVAAVFSHAGTQISAG